MWCLFTITVWRFVPVASASMPPPAGYGMNGGYGTCIKRDPVWTTRGWRSDWVIDCAGKGAGYGGTAYYPPTAVAVAPVGYGYAGLWGFRVRGNGPFGAVNGLFGGLFGWRDAERRGPAVVTRAPSASKGPSSSTRCGPPLCPISRLNPFRARLAPPLERVARFDDLLEVAPNEEQALIFETKA